MQTSKVSLCLRVRSRGVVALSAEQKLVDPRHKRPPQARSRRHRLGQMHRVRTVLKSVELGSRQAQQPLGSSAQGRFRRRVRMHLDFRQHHQRVIFWISRATARRQWQCQQRQGEVDKVGRHRQARPLHRQRNWQLVGPPANLPAQHRPQVWLVPRSVQAA